jgi:hypothetical protein
MIMHMTVTKQMIVTMQVNEYANADHCDKADESDNEGCFETVRMLMVQKIVGYEVCSDPGPGLQDMK